MPAALTAAESASYSSSLESLELSTGLFIALMGLGRPPAVSFGFAIGATSEGLGEGFFAADLGIGSSLSLSDEVTTIGLTGALGF